VPQDTGADDAAQLLGEGSSGGCEPLSPPQDAVLWDGKASRLTVQLPVTWWLCPTFCGLWHVPPWLTMSWPVQSG